MLLLVLQLSKYFDIYTLPNIFSEGRRKGEGRQKEGQEQVEGDFHGSSI